MSSHDTDIRNVFELTAMNSDPDPAHMRALRERMTTLNPRIGARRRRRTLAVTGGLLLGLTAAGLGGTDAGRQLVRQIFTPVQAAHEITGQTADGNTWITVRTGGEPYTPEEAEAQKTEMDEVAAIRQAGGGRLVWLFEGPGTAPGESMHTSCSIAYKLSSGGTTTVGECLPTGQQAVNTRIAEIVQLRDSGAGQIISQRPDPVGLGRFKIRFTLSDGSTVSLWTYYPPGPRQEREAIFAETRQLKEQREFTVLHPWSANGQLWGTLRYKLADGRPIGIVEEVPADMLSPDGKHVVTSAEEPAEPAETEFPQDQGGMLEQLGKLLSNLPEED